MPSFAERLVGGGFPIAHEITPPKTPKQDVLIRRASMINGSIGTVDIVQRKGRQNSLEAAATLAIAGFDPIWHLVTNSTSPDGLSAVLKRASNFGLNQALIVKGDEPKAHELTVAEAITLISKEHPNLLIGIAFNQYANPIENQIKTAAVKIEAGACYIQTQPIFDISSQIPILKALKMAAPDSKLVAMCMPLTSVETAKQIEGALGIPIETTLLYRLGQDGPEAGWAHFQSTLRRIAQSNLFDGLVVMTYEIDPSPEVGTKIAESLKLI